MHTPLPEPIPNPDYYPVYPDTPGSRPEAGNPYSSH